MTPHTDNPPAPDPKTRQRNPSYDLPTPSYGARDGWEFRIDRGGTFTDIVARTPHGRVVTCKLLSENPARYADAVTEGIRHILAREAATDSLDSTSRNERRDRKSVV